MHEFRDAILWCFRRINSVIVLVRHHLMKRFLVGIVLFDCGAKLIQSFNAIIGESDACCFWNVNDNGFLFGVVAIWFGFTLRAFVFVVTIEHFHFFASVCGFSFARSRRRSVYQNTA